MEYKYTTKKELIAKIKRLEEEVKRLEKLLNDKRMC